MPLNILLICWAEWEEALPPAADRVIEDAGVRVRVHAPLGLVLLSIVLAQG
jgi:hypothetical protein